MPPLEHGETPWWGWLVLGALAAWAIGGPILAAVAMPWLWLAYALGIALFWLLLKAYPNRFMSEERLRERGDASICAFRKDLNLRRIDPWIVRAVWDEIQPFLHTKWGRFPARVDDRWDEDLAIAGEDIDPTIESVAKRAGYSLENSEANPYYGKVVSLRDLIEFVNAQPCIRKAS